LRFGESLKNRLAHRRADDGSHNSKTAIIDQRLILIGEVLMLRAFGGRLDRRAIAAVKTLFIATA
jgi:hypothetical protein